MTLSKYLPYLVLAAIVAFGVALAVLTGAVPFSSLSGYLPFVLFFGIYLILVVIAAVCVPLARYFEENLHASRVARLTDTVGRVAGDIAEQLQQHPAFGTNASVIDAVKAGLVTEGTKYVQSVMPDTVAAIGITPGTLASMIAKEASGQLLTAAAAPVLAETVASAAASAVAAALATGASADAVVASAAIAPAVASPA